MQIAHFQHALEPGSKAYHYYFKLRDEPMITKDKLTEGFRNRYHFDTRRGSGNRHLKYLKINCSLKQAFSQLVREIERLSSLVND